MSIKVNAISKVYDQQKALDNVYLDISAGHIVGLLGPNGAGKTTLMKILTGFIPPSSGSAQIDGMDIFDDSLAIRRIVGYLPENNPLYSEMYVREYLEFAGGLYKIKKLKNRVSEIIGLTGLEPEMKKKIGALSKGYKQRVGLAQALIHEPKVLILDEPTSGLDPNQLVEIRSLIKTIGSEKTVLLSTHIMQEVEAICDRTVIIDKGKIVANEITGELHSLQKNDLVLLVEFKENLEQATLERLDGVKQVQKAGDRVWLITSVADRDMRQEIFNWAVAQQLTVLSLQKKERSLEQIFQDFTNKT